VPAVVGVPGHFGLPTLISDISRSARSPSMGPTGRNAHEATIPSAAGYGGLGILPPKTPPAPALLSLMIPAPTRYTKLAANCAVSI
jgi:hypothetical protein